LDKLISPLQSAFIPGRSIHDSILLTHEIIYKYKRTTGKSAWVVLKLDMEKIYDRIERDFIHNYLKVFGFHDIWIKWIMECITSVSYSLLINNEPTGFIKPSRGIRQGDPLSPYIFIMCMELLANNLIKESLKNNSGNRC